MPIAEGVPFVARGAAEREKQGQVDGDVQSVRSWVGSIRSVSLGSMGMGSMTRGWWGKQEPSEGEYILPEARRGDDLLASQLNVQIRFS